METSRTSRSRRSPSIFCRSAKMAPRMGQMRPHLVKNVSTTTILPPTASRTNRTFLPSWSMSGTSNSRTRAGLERTAFAAVTPFSSSARKGIATDKIPAATATARNPRETECLAVVLDGPPLTFPPEEDLAGRILAVARRGGRGCREPHDRAGSLPHLGIEADRPLVPLHDGTAYRESQAEAAAVKACGEERFRDPGLYLAGHPDPLVDDVHLHIAHFGIPHGVHADGLLVRGQRLKRVVQQVDHHLLQLLSRPHHRRQVLPESHFEPVRSFHYLVVQDPDGGQDDIVDPLRLVAVRLALPGEILQVPDDRLDPPRSVGYPLGKFRHHVAHLPVRQAGQREVAALPVVSVQGRQGVFPRGQDHRSVEHDEIVRVAHLVGDAGDDRPERGHPVRVDQLRLLKLRLLLHPVAQTDIAEGAVGDESAPRPDRLRPDRDDDLLPVVAKVARPRDVQWRGRADAGDGRRELLEVVRRHEQGDPLPLELLQGVTVQDDGRRIRVQDLRRAVPEEEQRLLALLEELAEPLLARP